MAHKINERNIGNSRLDGLPKKGSKKLTTDELDTIRIITEIVYNSMQYDNITETYTDGGRITLSLTGEQIYDLFQIKRKLTN